MTSPATPICFGDVVKLSTKVGDTTNCMGFLESKGNEHLLVLPPVKAKDKKFHEAEFIITPTRCEKPPANGTPLNYKQRFVLVMSSKFEEYSLNNKMNNEDTIGLQCRDVKGEMYLTIEKEGYTMEANVMDGDEGLDVVVVDSNRMRKKYNKKLASYMKNKCEFVSCGSKGKPLSLSIVKQPGATATAQFVQTKIVRRRSTLTQAKADEVGRANRVGSDVSDGDALSPTSAASPTSPTSPLAMAVATPIPESEASFATPSETALVDTAPTENNTDAAVSRASTAESTASNAEPAAAVAVAPVAPLVAEAAPDMPTTPLVDLLSDVTLEEKSGDPVVEVPATVVSDASAPVAEAPKVESAATVESAKPTAVTTSAVAAALATTLPPPTLATKGPASESADAQAATVMLASPKKLGQQQQSALTVTSEAEGTEDKLDSNCLGGNKCAIM